MDPYASPPFLGPLHAALSIDWKHLATLPASQQSHTVSVPALPLNARLAGVSLGERFVAFADAAPTTWTATVELGSATLLTSGVGASNPPASTLPVGQLPAPFYFGQPIGDQKLHLSISVLGSALPATVTSVSLAGFDFTKLNGGSLTLTTDDRGPFTVSFVAPTSAADVVDAIGMQTNVDPATSRDAGNHLVLKSQTTGTSATLQIIDGTALPVLGLAPVMVHGTGSNPATVTGTADLEVVTAAGGLNGLAFSFRTDDRGPFTVTFSDNPATADAVVLAVRHATNTDPAVVLSATKQLVFTSGNTGSSAFVEIAGATATLTALGLTAGYVYGTDGGALPAQAVGTANLETVAPALSGKTLTLSTDDRGPFNVLFGAMAHAADVVAAIEQKTNADPVATVSATHFLVLTSGSSGSTAYLKIIDGTALSTLGLTAGTYSGTGTLPSPLTPGVATGTTDMTTATLYGATGTLKGRSFTFQTDDRGPFTATFGTGSSAPASASDVLAAIAAATNTDPVVSLDKNNHLVLQSKNTGSTASLTIGGDAATTLGLTAGTIFGTAAPGLNAATAGRIDAHLFYFVDRR